MKYLETFFSMKDIPDVPKDKITLFFDTATLQCVRTCLGVQGLRVTFSRAIFNLERRGGPSRPSFRDANVHGLICSVTASETAVTRRRRIPPLASEHARTGELAHVRFATRTRQPASSKRARGAPR